MHIAMNIYAYTHVSNCCSWLYLLDDRGHFHLACKLTINNNNCFSGTKLAQHQQVAAAQMDMVDNINKVRCQQDQQQPADMLKPEAEAAPQIHPAG